ncbi:thioredoxin family protein [soil metagenome]
MKLFRILFLFVAAIIFMAHAVKADDIEDPTDWTVELKQTGAETYDLIFKVKIDKGWYVYGSYIDPNAGPIPTGFYYQDTTNTLFTFAGKHTEVGEKTVEGFDEMFGAEIKKFALGATFTQSIIAVDSNAVIKGYLEFMTCNHEKCLPPDNIDFEFDLAKKTAMLAGVVISKPDSTDAGKYGDPVSNCGETQEAQGLLTIFILGFLGGLLALVTPCVFPMIPLTVTFFTKGGKSGKKGVFDALFYGFCIVFIYFLLSVPFLIFDIPPDILNAFATNPWVNITFFVVFIVFAISFFGYFEITLPSSIANKADKASDVGGLIGIFFMAVTLAIVSFSCTGPILGSLLVGAISSEGGQYNLVVGMVGFGLALALPFALFAMFPGFLAKLPKSGGWLGTVKHVLGFVEVAFAIKFLSNADLVLQLGFIKRELFLALWILVGIALVLYLFGLIPMPHEPKPEKVGLGRKVTGAFFLAFTLYLIPGLWGTNLKLLSGFPPPMFYSWNKRTDNHLEAIVNDYDAAIAKAKAEGKPILLDYTGWACVNCRKMEETVWIEPEIRKLLEEKYVLVSLYVDEKTTLPEDQQYTSDATGKKVRNVGNYWSDMQIKYFKANAQPWYVIISPDERLLSTALGTSDVESYEKYLRCGLDAYKKHKNNLSASAN